MFPAVTRSVRGKLLAVVIVTTFTALVVAAAALTVYDLRTYEQSRVDDLTTLADVLGAASGPALAFNDVKGAQDNIALLRVRPSIIAGALYDARGTRVAAYAPEHLAQISLLGTASDSHVISGGQLVLSRSVMEKNERVGTLYLVAKYEAGQRLLNSSLIVGVVVMLSLLAAVGVSTWLQRTLSDPLIEVAWAARRVMEHRDFSVRVRKTTEDEIGYLVDTFNAMLDEVGQRSEALEESNRNLLREATERLAAEEARMESEGRFRVLADHAPVLVWLNDEKGCVFVNREYLRFTGRKLEELMGMAWTALVHAEDIDALLGRYLAAVEQRSQFEAEARIRRVDGQYRWFKWMGVPRFTSDGRLINYVGCSFDITEIKENIVELDRIQQELRDADRKKDEFLAVLSHELRNPLNPIRNAVAVLRMAGSDASKADWAAEIIDRQARQLSRLLDDLMDAARIAQNKVELRMQVVDISTVVEMAIETTRALIEKNHQKLEVSLPAVPVYVKADSARLAQVLGNILNNAAKYTDRDGHLLLKAAEEDGNVVVSVKDTGVGIAAEDLSRVFEMFTQLPENMHRAGGGLGIGLALVRALVEAQGGRVEARSAGLGKGSEFIVTFPTAPHPAFAGTPADGAALAGATGGLGILVADDVLDSVQSLAIGLRLLGHRVRMARDGVQALDAAIKSPPDVAILDIGMPGMTGYEVAARIREFPWGRDVLLVALTGWGQREDVRRAREAGFDHHLTKPADFAELKVLLDKVAARHGKQKPAAPLAAT